MASGRRSGQQNILRSLLDEEEPQEKTNEKISAVTSPPCTRSQTAQSQEASVGNKKLSPPNNGCQSPDPNCSICLGKLENKSFTDSCFHMFCFACLLEWSKVKAECPLCKQPFKSIIHNVRSYEDYDQYNIQEAQERASFPWESPEGFRFRYRTTVTFDRLMEAHYEEQQRQLRLLQRPTLIQTRSQWRRQRQTATSQFRHRIYLNSMRVTSVTSRKRRQRKIGPAFYRSNPACTHRLVPWLNRELNVLLHNQQEHVHFLMELIMDLIKRFDIESEESFEHLHSYLGRNTRHFLHEFASFARSPYDMVAYDQHAVYEPYTETVSDEAESFSSPGSDIIIVDDIITTTELPKTRSTKKHNKFPLDPDCHNLEQLSVIRGGPLSSANNIGISTTSMSGWDSPTPGPSGLFASPLHTEIVSTSLAVVDNSPSQTLSVKNEDEKSSGTNKHSGNNILPATSDSDTDSDDSVVIIKVEKPWYERTPITISSGSDEEIATKTLDSDSIKNGKSKRKLEEQSTSGYRDSSSDTIDVTSVTSEPKNKKHKHKDERTRGHKKHKHKKSSRHSHSSGTKSSEHSRHSEKQDSRKAAEERRKRRHSKAGHSLHHESRSHSAFTSVSSVYGHDDAVRGKYGEFFEWLHENDDRAYLYRQSWDSKKRHDSRSRSRSYESLWPSSSRSRSPTHSISPIKRRKHEIDSRQGRSRSSSIECIGVVGERKNKKKHKKHKKHKHKKSKPHVETIKSNSDIEVVDVVGDEDVLDLITSGDNSGSKPSNSEDGQDLNHPTDTEITAGSSSQQFSETPDSGKKYKKHPTGHKTSNFKPVKIKRNTELLKSLQNCMLPATSDCMQSEISLKVGEDVCHNSETNRPEVNKFGQCASALNLSLADSSSKTDVTEMPTLDVNKPKAVERPRSAEALGDIDVVTCDDLQIDVSPDHDSEATIVENEPEIDVENSDFETRIFSDQEIDVVTCDNESKGKHSSELDLVNVNMVKSSTENSLPDEQIDVVSVEPSQNTKDFCKIVSKSVEKDSSPEKKPVNDSEHKTDPGAAEAQSVSSESHVSSDGLLGHQAQTVTERYRKKEQITSNNLSIAKLMVITPISNEELKENEEECDITKSEIKDEEILTDISDGNQSVNTVVGDFNEKSASVNDLNYAQSSADKSNVQPSVNDLNYVQSSADKSNVQPSVNDLNYVQSSADKSNVQPSVNDLNYVQSSADKSNVQPSDKLPGYVDILSTNDLHDEIICGSKHNADPSDPTLVSVASS